MKRYTFLSQHTLLTSNCQAHHNGRATAALSETVALEKAVASVMDLLEARGEKDETLGKKFFMRIILRGTLCFAYTYYNLHTSMKTRTTNVVRNAGCARSRYTLKFFFFNQLMNESMNQSINRVYLERLIHR